MLGFEEKLFEIFYLKEKYSRMNVGARETSDVAFLQQHLAANCK